MKILDKYLLKEILRSSLAVFLIFMVILSSNTMLRLIEEASVGNFPTYLLFPVILVKITQYSIYVIPISLFFGIVISLGKFYNSNEMSVIFSSGISPIDLAKSLKTIIIATFIIVAIFSLYITPSATEFRYKLEHRLNSEEKVEEIRAGRFNSSQNGKATFFVDSIKNDTLHNIFFSSSKKKSNTIENSVTASYIKDKDERRYILLKDGVITEILPPYKGNTRTTKYLEHGVQLGQDLPAFINSKYEALSTYELFFLNNLEAKAELQSRLILPLATLILGFIAIPLSHSSPRKGRYNKIFLAALFYFSYFITMSLVKKMYLLEFTPGVLGLWWIHIILIAFIAFLYFQDSTKIPSRQ
ncbi:MAG: Lipopolysaccharide export system permease protein LptF [Gammaproteobacteria bacterium]|nr:MAG: Lipopolysaccharide export system permease protein LptF [Gammaproteobacteria bacterium]